MNFQLPVPLFFMPLHLVTLRSRIVTLTSLNSRRKCHKHKIKLYLKDDNFALKKGGVQNPLKMSDIIYVRSLT